MEEKPLPNLLVQAKNLTKSIIRNSAHVLSGGQMDVPEEELEARLLICVGCEFYRPSDKRCAECSCFLEEKAALTAEFCPFMKWPGDLFKIGDNDD